LNNSKTTTVQKVRSISAEIRFSREKLASSTKFQSDEEFYHRPKPSSGPFFDL